MKKYLCLLLMLTLVFSCITPVMADDGIKVNLDGKPIVFDVQPRAINNRTMVPLRAIFEALGATVDWNNDTQTVTSKKGDTTVSLTLNNDKMNVNGKEITLDSPACAIDGRTLVPVRAVSESFGLEVNWVAATQTVELVSAPTDELTKALNCYGTAQTVYIAGSLAGVDWTGGRNGTLVIKDKSSGAVRYQEQFVSDEKGRYELRFAFDGNLASCSITVKEGENIVTSGVSNAYAENPSMYSVFVKDKDNNALIDGGELSGVISKINSAKNDGGNYKILVAFYAKGGSYLDYQEVAEGRYESGSFSKEIKGIKVPQDTAIIKAFLCSNIRTKIAVVPKEQKNADDMKFGGDTSPIKVAFIGDSITIQTQYLKGIEHYYHTRYPGKDITFVSKGIGGNQTKDVINRFARDIANDSVIGKIDEATLLMGMNDLVVVPMTGSVKTTYMGSEDIQNQKLNDYLQNVKTLINRCKEADISLTIVTTSLYDDSKGFTRATSAAYAYGVNEVLGKGMEALKALAKENKIPVIDLWTPTTEITNSLREGGEIGSVITGLDRVHPDEQGGLYMAYQFVKQQDGNPIVAKVSIDANSKTANTENATVRIVTSSSSRVEYSYLPKAIPFAYTLQYKNWEDMGVPITKDINQEIIKVSGLSDGTYTIRIGDNTLSGTYTAAELANGVNIATNENNPAQIQSQEAYELLKIKLANEQTYRGIARTEQALDSKGYQASDFKENATKEDLAVLGTNAAFTHYFSGDPENYGSKKYQAENWEKICQQDKAARDAALPVRRTVVIEKQ